VKKLLRHPVVLTNMIFAIAAGAGMGVSLALGLYVQSATFAVLMLLSCFMPLWYKRGYRDGWLMGRHAMLNSMAEATRRKMSFPEWIETQFEQDGISFVKIEVEGDE